MKYSLFFMATILSFSSDIPEKKVASQHYHYKIFIQAQWENSNAY